MSRSQRRMFAFGVLLAASLLNCSATERTVSLIDLVPSEAGLVAGMEARNVPLGSRLVFLPLPGKGFRDFDYFHALSGADPSLSVKEVIFVDSQMEADGYEHALLVRGHFQTEILLRSALNQGAMDELYRGVRVLRVPPLARERSEFHEFTWLTVIDSRILLLGSPGYVRQEIDRWLSKSRADGMLREEFENVQRDDVWWIQLKDYNTSAVNKALVSLSPSLLVLTGHQNLCVGTRFGRNVVFEYHAGISGAQVPSFSGAEVAEPEYSRHGQFAFRSGSETPEMQAPLHGVIKISNARYSEWVSKLAAVPRSYR